VPSSIWIDGQRLTEQNVAHEVEKGARGAVCMVSSGRCLPSNRFRIVDANHIDLPDHHLGEIVLQSDSLFDGYYNRPDLTEKVLKDGWYWSGDLGFCRQR
jgi:long-subunit acyl-CoA synthetase (AMP-forming)